jgi:murein DD-endopeptidase MepM/ murein hydrolase activator NlpD
MKKFYHFSNKSLNFVEIKHFKAKLTSIFIASVIVFSSVLLGVFYTISILVSSDQSLSIIRNENSILKQKLTSLSDKYVQLESKLSDITQISDDLRLAAGLEPISPEEKLLGIGGIKSVDNLFDGINPDINNTIEVVDNVIRKFEFEKAQFDEISSKLKKNNDLYESIPAIMPTTGRYSSESFGMRLHPILKLRKMHNGIDILNDVGTPVKVTGKGKVVFVGRNSGYGLAVEVDHGYGYRTVYAHLSRTLVKEGQKVKRGDIIAKSGNSGLSSGPHLHYEVQHNGQSLNPSEFFFDEFNFFESNIN